MNVRIFYVLSLLILTASTGFSQNQPIDKWVARGTYFYKQKDYRKAVVWLEKAGREGHLPSQVLLGDVYYRGLLGRQDYGAAQAWYSNAAYEGNRVAQYRMGVIYSSNAELSSLLEDKKGDQKMSHHSNQYYRKAVSWFEKSAKQGYMLAQYDLGLMYRLGYGVHDDRKQAAFWFEKAARQGYALAQANLGALYRDARLLNTEKALMWMRKSLAQKERPVLALCNLADIYSRGLYGVRRDVPKALKFAEEACRRGHTHICKRIPRLKKIIEKGL